MSRRQKKTKNPNKEDSSRRRPGHGGRSAAPTTRAVVQVDARRLANILEGIRKPQPSVSSSTTPSLTLAEMPGTLEQVGHEADRAWAGVKKIMSLLNTEFKAYDGNLVSSTANWNGNVIDFTSLILQGDADTQRDGDSCKLQRFHGRLSFSLGATPTNSTVRFVVGRYKVGVLSAATIASELCDYPGTISAPRTIYASWDRRKNYDILFERIFEMDTVAHPRHYLEFDLKLDFDTQWIASGTTIAANGLFIATYSTLTSGVTAPFFDGVFRVEFTDN